MLAVLARVSRRAAFAVFHRLVPLAYPHLSCPSDFHHSRGFAKRQLDYSYSICAHLRTLLLFGRAAYVRAFPGIHANANVSV